MGPIWTTVPKLPWQDGAKRGCDVCGRRGTLSMVVIAAVVKFLCRECKP